eukprot:Nk52_evm47s239 gene=Nk52_evmTU47s239
MEEDHAQVHKHHKKGMGESSVHARSVALGATFVAVVSLVLVAVATGTPEWFKLECGDANTNQMCKITGFTGYDNKLMYGLWVARIQHSSDEHATAMTSSVDMDCKWKPIGNTKYSIFFKDDSSMCNQYQAARFLLVFAVVFGIIAVFFSGFAVKGHSRNAMRASIFNGLECCLSMIAMALMVSVFNSYPEFDERGAKLSGLDYGYSFWINIAGWICAIVAIVVQIFAYKLGDETSELYDGEYVAPDHSHRHSHDDHHHHHHDHRHSNVSRAYSHSSHKLTAEHEVKHHHHHR